MSGNSSRSWLSTSPIDECERLAIALAADDDAQPVAADLHFVAVVEFGLVDAFAVHIRTVERTDILQREARVGTFDHDMPARHRDVVEEDVGLRMPADRCLRLIDSVR